MADDHVFSAALEQHVCGKLACIGAFLGKVHILSADMDLAALDGCLHRVDIHGGNAHDYVTLGVLDEGLERLNQRGGLIGSFVHLPVSGNNRFTHS